LTQRSVTSSSPEDQADLTSFTPESFPSVLPVVHLLQQDVTVSEADSKDAVEDAVETEEPSTQQPSLPAELLHDIVSLCEPASLLSLCLANTVLREIASPILYKSLSLYPYAGGNVPPRSESVSFSLSVPLLRTHTRTVPQKETNL
jgi:hypothetical protein